MFTSSIFKALDPRIEMPLVIAEAFLLKIKCMALSSIVLYSCGWVQLAMNFNPRRWKYIVLDECEMLRKGNLPMAEVSLGELCLLSGLLASQTHDCLRKTLTAHIKVP